MQIRSVWKGDIVLLLCHDDESTSSPIMPSFAVTKMFQSVIDFAQIKLHQKQICFIDIVTNRSLRGETVSIMFFMFYFKKIPFQNRLFPSITTSFKS